MAENDGTRDALKRAVRAAAYLLLGVVVTGGVALVLLNLTQPVQQVVYDLFYLRVGPSEATETAILAHFLLAGLAAISVAMLAGDYLSDRLAHRTAFGTGITVLLGMLLVVALAGLAAFLTALIVLAAASLAIPLLLRYRYGVRSGGIPAFVGGVPVLVLLLLLAGFGIGWGWGYVVTAEEVPLSAVNGTAVTFDEVAQEIEAEDVDKAEYEYAPIGWRRSSNRYTLTPEAVDLYEGAE